MIFSKYYLISTYYILGSDKLSKLPRIFHNNEKFITNNKNSYINFKATKEENKKENNYIPSVDVNNLINFFNKKVSIILKNNNESTGVLISKRGDIILLDNGEKINIKDIADIK